MEENKIEEAEIQEEQLTSDFIEEMKSSRLFCILKTAVILAVFAAACIFVTRSFWIAVALIAIFIIIKKFVQVGSSMTYQYFNTLTKRDETGDHGFLGLLVGMVAIYAVVLGIQKLNELFFPPYFFPGCPF